MDFVVPFLMMLDGKKYCVEPFIKGEYKKHSNNRYYHSLFTVQDCDLSCRSGFVEVEHIRNTPHAFSHFSLIQSGTHLACHYGSRF